jgi:hypothetical protein
MSWLLTDVRTLRGTCYFEFLPGRYSNKCWSVDSVFLTEDVFAHIEPTFEKHRPNFGHYSFTDISRSQWSPIISDLTRMRDFLASQPVPAEVFGHVGFFTARHKDAFAEDFGRNVSELRSTIVDLVQWITRTLESHDAISVLGL